MHPAEALLDDVCGNDPKRVAAALQAARGRGEELVPGIVSRLEAVLAAPTAWSAIPEANPSFLLFLAAEFRATVAHVPIVRLFRLGEPLAYDLLGDVITEDGATILADTYPGDPTALLALVEDTKAGPFERNAGLRALAILWRRGRFPREDLLALMLKLATNFDPEQDNDALVGNGLIEVALHIHATEIRDTILGLYERDLAEVVFVEPEYVAEVLARSTPDPAEQARLDTTIDDAWQCVEHWCFFKAEDHRPAEASPVDHGRTVGAAHLDGEGNAIPYKAPPKVGRNDPCPCGSGKKFKKCCGA